MLQTGHWATPSKRHESALRSCLLSGNTFPYHCIIAPAQTYPIAMADDDVLVHITNAVRGARSAFQSLRSGFNIYHAPDHRDLPALEAGLQALGKIAEVLEGFDTADARLGFVNSILSAHFLVYISNRQISMAEAMISDMLTLERRLRDVEHDLSLERSKVPGANVEVFAPGETIRIRAMVEKYCSIIITISSDQSLCVFHLQRRYPYSHCEGIRIA
jgi:hypothetical protein